MRKGHLYLATCLAITPVSGALAQPSSAAASRAADEEADDATIVVTAQRRDQSLLETPLAVSVYDSSALEARQLNSVADLQTIVPGMQVGDSYGTAAITIRGIGTVEVLQGADPGVAYHIEGVYLGRQHLAAAAFFDAKRVEILRGPQGTLFGRNSTGGTVNFIPAEPEFAFGAQVSGTLQIDPFAYQAEGHVTGPISDTVAFRISGQKRFNDGFTTNLAADGPGKLDDSGSITARGQLLFESKSGFEAKLALEYYNADTNSSGHFLRGTPSGATPIGIALGGTAPNIKDRELHTNYGSFDLTYWGAILKLSRDVGIGTVTSTSSYYDSSSRFVNDFDGTEVDFTSTDLDNDARQFYQELLLTGNITDRLSMVLGGNYFWEKSNQAVVVPINFPGMPLQVDIESSISTESYALFGHLDYKLTDQLEIFGGVRYTHDSKKAFRSNNFVGQSDDNASWSAVAYEVGALWEVANRTNLTLRYTKGYKGGGFESSNPLAPAFDPEYARSYELGLRTQQLNDRVSLFVNAFYQEYSNLQVNQIVGVSNAVVNAASATVYGIEIEGRVKPVPQATLEFTMSHLNATFDDFMTADASRPALGVLDLAGNNLRNSPELSFSIGAYYEIPIAASASLELGARYYWQDEIFFNEFNLPVASQKSVGRLDLSLGFKTDDDKWRAAIFATNVTDETVFNDVVVVSDILASSALGKLSSGRQIGIRLTREF